MDGEFQDSILAEVDAAIAAGEAAAPHLARVDLAGFDTADIPPQRFIIPELLPVGVVTLLGAHGGAGKSSLALVWAAYITGGSAWNGDVRQDYGRVLLVTLEDGADTVRARLQHIVRTCRLDARRIAERLTVLDGSNTDGLLMVDAVMPGGARDLVATPLMRQVADAAYGHCLVIVDNASDAFGGNENERRQVRRFVRALGQIAKDSAAAVLLLAHIDKQTAKSGSSEAYSGSTAWHNSARSRLALTKDELGRIVLSHQKHNFSKGAPDIELHWRDAVLVPGAADRSDARAAETAATAKAVQTVVTGMQRILADGLTIPTADSGGHTCWQVLQTDPKVKALGKAAAREAITRAERQHLIVRETYKTADRKVRSRWSIGALAAPMEG